MKKPQPIHEIHAELRNDILDDLSAIKKKLDPLLNAKLPLWADIGDLRHYKAIITELADKLMERREYAPENRVER